MQATPSPARRAPEETGTWAPDAACSQGISRTICVTSTEPAPSQQRGETRTAAPSARDRPALRHRQPSRSVEAAPSSTPCAFVQRFKPCSRTRASGTVPTGWSKGRGEGVGAGGSVRAQPRHLRAAPAPAVQPSAEIISPLRGFPNSRDLKGTASSSLNPRFRTPRTLRSGTLRARYQPCHLQASTHRLPRASNTHTPPPPGHGSTSCPPVAAGACTGAAGVRHPHRPNGRGESRVTPSGTLKIPGSSRAALFTCRTYSQQGRGLGARMQLFDSRLCHRLTARASVSHPTTLCFWGEGVQRWRPQERNKVFKTGGRVA